MDMNHNNNIDWMNLQISANNASSFIGHVTCGWNIQIEVCSCEKKYDYSRFDDMVLAFNYHPYPMPPLKMLFEITAAMDSWIRADPKNVVAVHCAVSVYTACLSIDTLRHEW